MKQFLLFALVSVSFLTGFSGSVLAQLPAPLPKIESIVTGDPAPGYIFIGPRSRNISDTLPGSIMVCDNKGNPVWHYTLLNNSSYPYDNSYPVDFKLLNDSTMSFATRRTGDYEFYFLDPNFNLIDTVDCFETDEHEIIQDNQGNLYYLCKEYSNADCSVLNQSNGSPGLSNCTVVDLNLVVQDPNGNIIREWKTFDNLPLEETQSVYYTVPGLLDHAHTNSIAFDLDSNLILSHRNLFQIMKIDRFTGDVIWRFGGDTGEFTLVNDNVPFTGQHDARIAPNGNLYLFDNGSFQVNARYVEYELDTVAMTATLVREHYNPHNEIAAIMGGSQLLPNGNVIVCWGGNFLQSHVPKITEFDLNGDVVMEMKLPQQYTSYRVQKTELPFEIVRPTINCDNGTMTLNAPSGYATYAWNTGDTTQSIAISDTGSYQVWVNYGVGFVSSTILQINDLNNICLGLSSEKPQIESLTAYPNPTNSTVRVQIPQELASKWELTIRDLTGRIVLQQNGKQSGEIEVDATPFVNGLYEIVLKGKDKTYTGKLIKQ